MSKVEKYLNILLIFILSGILAAALGIQIFLGEKPCPLCLLQRVGMFSVAAGALLNLRFGTRTSHYGLILISSLVGGFVALRQIALHVCPGFPEFGIPVLGISLYTWSFFIFVACILYTSFLLFLFTYTTNKEPRHFSTLEKSAFITIATLATLNIITTLMQCGFGPCAE